LGIMLFKLCWRSGSTVTPGCWSRAVTAFE
jgi:hypothetical protein